MFSRCQRILDTCSFEMGYINDENGNMIRLDCTGMFYQCGSIIDSSNCIFPSRMQGARDCFAYCGSMKFISNGFENNELYDYDEINIQQNGYVKTLAQMFYNCGNLNDVSNFTLPKNRWFDLSGMFHNCRNLQIGPKIHEKCYPKFMNQLFFYCGNLTTCSFDTIPTSAVDYKQILSECPKLVKVPFFRENTFDLCYEIAEKYYNKYGEELEYKNVFYFKALLEEVKKDKTYDRIVISEDLEQFYVKSIEAFDRIIFNYIDSITDEIEDSEIIFICSDRRTKQNDSFVERLFNIGVYNMLIGDERTIEPLCDCIKKPLNKKEAKRHLHITSIVSEGSPLASDDTVEEDQIMSILKYYDNMRINGKTSQAEYVKAFDDISEQYNKNQLKVILLCLPADVRNAVYDSNTVPNPQTVNQGLASEFRGTVNNNFEAVNESFKKVDLQIENVYKNMVGIVISPDPPTGLQKAGDFWFKDLSASSSEAT